MSHRASGGSWFPSSMMHPMLRVGVANWIWPVWSVTIAAVSVAADADEDAMLGQVGRVDDARCACVHPLTHSSVAVSKTTADLPPWCRIKKIFDARTDAPAVPCMCRFALGDYSSPAR